MSGIVGSRLNNRGSGLIGSLGTDGQVLTSSGAGASAIFEAVAAEDNQPVWYGRKPNPYDQYISRTVYTKVTRLDEADVIDTHSAFSDSRFTCPADEGGNYFVHGCILGVFKAALGYDGEDAYTTIYKNGVQGLKSGFQWQNDGEIGLILPVVSGVIPLDVGDYVELYGRLTDEDDSGDAHINGGVGTNFGGFKISS